MFRWDSKLLLVVGLGLVVACAGPVVPSADTVPGPAATRPPQSGGRVVLGILADVAGLNPNLKTDPQTTTVARRIYESLVIDDPQTGQPRPRLAESWTTSPDGVTLSYTLRDKLTWSDGSPLTVDDVAFSLMMTLRSRTAPTRQDAPCTAHRPECARQLSRRRMADRAGVSWGAPARVTSGRRRNGRARRRKPTRSGFTASIPRRA
jgi:ABC-type transport system substrate-binding protein